MDESTQQAIQLGINVFIFIVALTLGINLVIGVRDVANLASEYNASLPSGSRVVTVEQETERTIKGTEIVSYYSNYITDLNRGPGNVSEYIIKIQSSDGSKTVEGKHDSLSVFLTECKNNGINIKNDFEVIIDSVDIDGNITVILKEIE